MYIVHTLIVIQILRQRKDRCYVVLWDWDWDSRAVDTDSQPDHTHSHTQYTYTHTEIKWETTTKHPQNVRNRQHTHTVTHTVTHTWTHSVTHTHTHTLQPSCQPLWSCGCRWWDHWKLHSEKCTCWPLHLTWLPPTAQCKLYIKVQTYTTVQYILYIICITHSD